MEKRVLLALILSMLIIITWSVLVPRPTPLPPLPLRQPAHTEIVNISKPIAQQLVTLSTTQYEINFIESQAAIQDIVFKAYQSYRYNLQYGFSLDDPNLIFHREKGPADEMVFSADDGRRQIIKRFIFHNSNYNIELEIDILNKSGNPMKMNTPLILGLVDFTGNQTRVRLQDATIALKEKILHPNVHKDVTYAETRFLAIRDQYFCAIVEFPKETFSAHIKKINSQ